MNNIVIELICSLCLCLTEIFVCSVSENDIILVWMILYRSVVIVFKFTIMLLVTPDQVLSLVLPPFHIEVE